MNFLSIQIYSQKWICYADAQEKLCKINLFRVDTDLMLRFLNNLDSWSTYSLTTRWWESNLIQHFFNMQKSVNQQHVRKWITFFLLIMLLSSFISLSFFYSLFAHSQNLDYELQKKIGTHSTSLTERWCHDSPVNYLNLIFLLSSRNLHWHVIHEKNVLFWKNFHILFIFNSMLPRK